ncbi:mannitol dehydrogenase family protein [Pelagibacterium halotolerans]|uniref:D-mannonate oxidoreductase n=1 Tax=Pelagibacterium halotolerans (strain DSM 22347 / JCM 15775 / CGMCC 1.7692 / B2) TaxID=1082931 RepID=G4RBE5_PELHB|nr:mannitol dehydrogenase family protein [Pelagibacterium halotolerans]AEQ52621.1 D-mannonate oxidoreductase [Pelagibacterium halotolerans B2]QJR17670.1 mannitol dehydrogenase family protein [Pelagibacterium halotolerans]SEA83349.1 fructuronate reductase [Pelagibacterium halotolerans]
MTLLERLDQVPAGMTKPAFDPAAHGVGIVHLGLGAFLRAHLAIYTEDALAHSGGDWRILAVGLRSRDSVDALNAQHGLYTLITRDAESRYRVCGAIAGAVHAPSEPQRLHAALAAETTRIVSLTITEKGYGIDARTNGLDSDRDDIAADLASDVSAPRSAVGWIVAGLAARRAAGATPFTVLSCDNLSNNGAVLKRLVVEFAERRDPDLARWIADSVSFPSTMVDRITPAQTEATRTDARAALGCEDHAAIETEPFSQWVIEDDFGNGRPDWHLAGAVMAHDVAPYERMKLRMLNGAHSLIAYAGFLAGHDNVRDAMTDPALVRRVETHMRAAAQSLDPVPGIDLDAYRSALLARFANRAIAHPTYQIAMDGTQKLPPRIFETATIVRNRDGDIASFAFATAAWMAYTRGTRDDGTPYALRDPRQVEIADASRSGKTPSALYDALASLPGFMPASLRSDDKWCATTITHLTTMLTKSMRAAIDAT